MSLPTDKELDDYLKGGSEISRRYRSLASEEPPVELDRAVLSQARTAVDSAASPVARSAHRKVSRWAVPFAAAATVVLSFFIIRGMGPDALMQGTPSPASAPVHPQVLRESDEGIATDLVTARQRAEISSEQKKSQSELLVGAASSISAPAPAPASEPALTSTPVLTPPPSALPQSEMPMNPPAESTASQEAAKAVMAKRDSSGVYMSSAFERRDAQDSKSANAQLQRVQDKAEAALPRSAPVWLDDIRKLRAEGKRAEADAELKRFLEEYPGYFEKNPGVSRP